MALAYIVKHRFPSAGNLNIRVVDVTLDAAYAAGGYTLDPQKMGFGSNGQIVYVLSGPADGYLTEYDEATNKLKVRDVSSAVGVAAIEVANALAALNGVIVRILAYGIGHG